MEKGPFVSSSSPLEPDVQQCTQLRLSPGQGSSLICTLNSRRLPNIYHNCEKPLSPSITAAHSDLFPLSLIEDHRQSQSTLAHRGAKIPHGLSRAVQKFIRYRPLFLARHDAGKYCLSPEDSSFQMSNYGLILSEPTSSIIRGIVPSFRALRPTILGPSLAPISTPIADQELDLHLP
ncbi:hypothetical protein BDV98DRAFT_572854 [Pterulicium gracile]|uniref:Uncharacterized protein n=1 Tax=Pterulicium gracile TaxID=1884261 RepID=A0A5C3Q963_9AGAR|nr:hypothetical protein BDV98DRAFT_572854 [Pterula gracilis]